MIYAAIVLCHMGGCVALTDNLGPYDSAEACQERLHAMRADIIATLGHLRPLHMRALCGPLDEVRRVIPGAFPGVAAEVEV